MTAANITQSARILGINKSTLILALKPFPATPVGMQGFRSSPVPVYDVRDGLCFDCYCHDHGKLFDKTGFVAIWDAVRANARDVAAKSGATSKKTGNNKGNDEKREERAENDVNERAAQ